MGDDFSLVRTLTPPPEPEAADVPVPEGNENRSTLVGHRFKFVNCPKLNGPFDEKRSADILQLAVESSLVAAADAGMCVMAADADSDGYAEFVIWATLVANPAIQLGATAGQNAVLNRFYDDNGVRFGWHVVSGGRRLWSATLTNAVRTAGAPFVKTLFDEVFPELHVDRRRGDRGRA